MQLTEDVTVICDESKPGAFRPRYEGKLSHARIVYPSGTSCQPIHGATQDADEKAALANASGKRRHGEEWFAVHLDGKPISLPRSDCRARYRIADCDDELSRYRYPPPPASPAKRLTGSLF